MENPVLNPDQAGRQINSNFKTFKIKIMNMFKIKLMKICLFILMSASLAFGQNGHSEKIDELLSMLHNQQQFNGSIIIAEKGKITFKKSYGAANQETNRTVDENTVFELASVSKQFTAMGIVILKERGKLSYDDKLTKFFPELEEYKNVSIRNLLNHTSGIPDYINPTSLSSFDPTKINKNQDVINYLIKNKIKLDFEPNTKFAYSNTGYVLLASIIEKVSGKSFGDFLHKSIFKPLKMNNTFVYMRRLAPRKIDNYAFGYAFSYEKNKYTLPDEMAKFVVFLDGIVGDGNISSTAMDMLKWDRALRAEKLISKESLKEIYTPAVLSDKTPTKYGFGWFIENNKDYGDFVWHSGSFPGYKTYIGRHLTNDKTIIILQNYNDVVLPSSNIAEIVYDKPMTKIYRKQINIDAEILAKYIGEYKDKADEKNTITLTKGDNCIIYNSSTKHKDWDLKLFPESNNYFFAKVTNIQIEFATTESGEITLKLYQSGKLIGEGVKIKQPVK